MGAEQQVFPMVADAMVGRDFWSPQGFATRKAALQFCADQVRWLDNDGNGLLVHKHGSQNIPLGALAVIMAARVYHPADVVLADGLGAVMLRSLPYGELIRAYLGMGLLAGECNTRHHSYLHWILFSLVSLAESCFILGYQDDADEITRYLNSWAILADLASHDGQCALTGSRSCISSKVRGTRSYYGTPNEVLAITGDAPMAALRYFRDLDTRGIKDYGFASDVDGALDEWGPSETIFGANLAENLALITYFPQARTRIIKTEFGAMCVTEKSVHPGSTPFCYAMTVGIVPRSYRHDSLLWLPADRDFLCVNDYRKRGGTKGFGSHKGGSATVFPDERRVVASCPDGAWSELTQSWVLEKSLEYPLGKMIYDVAINPNGTTEILFPTTEEPPMPESPIDPGNHNPRPVPGGVDRNWVLNARKHLAHGKLADTLGVAKNRITMADAALAMALGEEE